MADGLPGVPPPDFYLASSEDLERAPNACHVTRRLASEHRDDLLLVWLETPILARDAGQLGETEVWQVILATRFQGETLFPIVRWPTFVNVFRSRIRIGDADRVRTADLALWDLGALYQTLEAATANTW
jgi:hypothetical protein